MAAKLRVKAPQAKEGGDRVNRKCVEANAASWDCDRHTDTLQLLMLRSPDVRICPVLYPHPASWPYILSNTGSSSTYSVCWFSNELRHFSCCDCGPHKKGWAELASSRPRRLFTKLIHQFSWLMRMWMIFLLSLHHLPPPSPQVIMWWSKMHNQLQIEQQRSTGIQTWLMGNLCFIWNSRLWYSYRT